MSAYACNLCRCVQYTETPIIPFCPFCGGSEYTRSDSADEIICFNLELGHEDYICLLNALETAKDNLGEAAKRRAVIGWYAILNRALIQTMFDDGHPIILHLYFEKSALNAMINDFNDTILVLAKHKCSQVAISHIEIFALDIEQKMNALN